MASKMENLCISFNKVCTLGFLCCKSSLGLPPLARGGSSESDGGSAFSERRPESNPCYWSSKWGLATPSSFPHCGGVGKGKHAAEL
jgi:hypothetical protein